jgi:anthranilate synthase component II
MLCLIDNYDSFTYNLVHYFEELGAEVKVILNDEKTVEEVLAMNPEKIVLSPGPGTPDESGISKELLKAAAIKKIPTLGVCLGHEIIAEVFGGRVVHASRVMHAKQSKFQHDESRMFHGIPNNISIARYHSLVVEKESFPSTLKVTGWADTENQNGGEIMSLEHVSLPIYGVQFHPESVLTDYGHAFLKNFLTV